MKTSIICLGNRLLHEDSAGPAVYDYLRQLELPEEVEIYEGGTAGLNLIPLLEQGGRVIFVDSVSGFTSEGSIVILDQRAIVENVPSPAYGHDIGLPHVLSLLPQVTDGMPPHEVLLIGIEGEWSEATIKKSADLCLAEIEKNI